MNQKPQQAKPQRKENPATLQYRLQKIASTLQGTDTRNARKELLQCLTDEEAIAFLKDENDFQAALYIVQERGRGYFPSLIAHFDSCLYLAERLNRQLEWLETILDRKDSSK